MHHSDLFYPRLYLELWYIKQQDNVMNREVAILPHVYKGSYDLHVHYILQYHLHILHSITVFLSFHLCSSRLDDGIGIDIETLANSFYSARHAGDT